MKRTAFGTNHAAVVSMMLAWFRDFTAKYYLTQEPNSWLDPYSSFQREFSISSTSRVLTTIFPYCQTRVSTGAFLINWRNNQFVVVSANAHDECGYVNIYMSINGRAQPINNLSKYPMWMFSAAMTNEALAFFGSYLTPRTYS